MSSALRDVVSGALFHELRASTLANNLANISTIGFKEDKVAFTLPGQKENPSRTGRTPSGATSPQQFYLGNPVQTYTNLSAGQIVHTGNSLDLSLHGSGFFSVQTPEGIQYTRSGNFTLNSEGTLVTMDGYPVLGDGGEIQIGDGKVEIDGSGNISVDGSTVERLKIADFPRQSGLIKTGDNRFVPANPGIREQAAENVLVEQGSIEHSNVDAVRSMTEMIEVLRGYESYQKVIQFLNDANEKVISDVGRSF